MIYVLVFHQVICILCSWSFVSPGKWFGYIANAYLKGHVKKLIFSCLIFGQMIMYMLFYMMLVYDYLLQRLFWLSLCGTYVSWSYVRLIVVIILSFFSLLLVRWISQNCFCTHVIPLKTVTYMSTKISQKMILRVKLCIKAYLE